MVAGAPSRGVADGKRRYETFGTPGRFSDRDAGRHRGVGLPSRPSLSMPERGVDDAGREPADAGSLAAEARAASACREQRES